MLEYLFKQLFNWKSSLQYLPLLITKFDLYPVKVCASGGFKRIGDGLDTVDTRCSPNADLMLGHRLRRWPNIKSALGECLVFAGIHQRTPVTVVRGVCPETRVSMAGR